MGTCILTGTVNDGVATSNRAFQDVKRQYILFWRFPSPWPRTLMHGAISLFEGGEESLHKLEFKRQAAYFSNLGRYGHGLLLALLQSILQRLCVFLHLRYGLVRMKFVEIFRWRNPE